MSECKPLPPFMPPGVEALRFSPPPPCRGLHSSAFQLNLCRLLHKSNPQTPPDTPLHPLITLEATPKRLPYPTGSA